VSGAPRPPALDRALADVKSRLVDAFGERLREVRLFGSMARGDSGPDPDVDLLVLLDRLESSHERIAAIDVVVGAALDHELPIEPLVLDESELDRLRRVETALGHALDHEGVRL
jgi:predicted nucleotidyltransferase